MLLYKEIVIGATGYPSAPAMTTNPPGWSGAPNDPLGNGWEPQFHQYRMVAGPSGSDVMVSFDGKNDAQRVPFNSTLILPIYMPVAYRSVWLKSIAGITGTIGAGFYRAQ